jgi:hypothetical protein
MQHMLRPMLATAALILLAGHAHAEGPSIGSLAGRWTVDVSRLPVPVEARPRSVTITFADVRGGRLSTRVEVVDPAGTVIAAESIAELNGTPVEVKGNLEADTIAAAMPAPGVLIMQLVRGGIPGSTRVYTVAADGKTMVETAANVGDDGRPFMRTNYFSRVP